VDHVHLNKLSSASAERIVRRLKRHWSALRTNEGQRYRLSVEVPKSRLSPFVQVPSSLSLGAQPTQVWQQLGGQRNQDGTLAPKGSTATVTARSTLHQTSTGPN
jgi:hypothetical protein